jgi:O-antigen/teichoic acid export membrane protein
MWRITIGTGVLLILVGVVGYFATGRVSWTALIPAIPGLIFVVLGAVARAEKVRRHAMHVAAAVALLGFLGSAGGLLKLPHVIMGHPVERSGAVVSRSIMAIVCAVFVALCVRSFLLARRRTPSSGPTE